MLKLRMLADRERSIKLSSLPLTLGSDESNHMAMTAPRVSDFHAEIHRDEDGLYIVDLLSAGGTFVNEQRVLDRSRLSPWDVVRLGTVELEIDDPNTCRPGSWALRMGSDLLSSQFHPLQERTVVGRGPECDLTIDSNLLSRRHAELVIDGDRVRVVDLGSRNGTYLNGKRIGEAVAVPGDELGFDELRFVIVGPVGVVSQAEADEDQTQLRDGGVDLAAPPSEQSPSEQSPTALKTVLVPAAPALGAGATGGGDEPGAGLDARPAEEPGTTGLPVGRTPPDDEEKTVLMPPLSLGRGQDSEETLWLAEPLPGEETLLFAGAEVESSPQAFLRVASAGEGERYGLEQAVVALGRADDNDLVVQGSGVSKYHAVLRQQGDAWQIEDQRSRNGLEVNGARVERAQLAHGDQIGLGTSLLVFELDESTAGDETAWLGAAMQPRRGRAEAVARGRVPKVRPRWLWPLLGGVVAGLLLLLGYGIVIGLT